MRGARKHGWWRTQARLDQKSRWKQWPASLRPPPRVAHAKKSAKKFFTQKNFRPNFCWPTIFLTQLELICKEINHFFKFEFFNGSSILVQACLRAPHVVADEAKLVIVFTYFFLLLFGPGGLRAPLVVADEAKLAIVFTYFFLFLSFSPTPSAFHPLRGNSRAWKFVSPNILA